MTPFTPTRRDALRIGSIGALGLGHVALAAESPKLPATADAVVFLHLKGGPSHLDTLDMKASAPAEEKGEFKPIASKIAARVCFMSRLISSASAKRACALSHSSLAEARRMRDP